jgi:hypothetical protein
MPGVSGVTVVTNARVYYPPRAASVTGVEESIPFYVIHSPGTGFCPGSAQGRRLMGFIEEQVGQSAEGVIAPLDASTTRVTAWPGPSSRRRDFASGRARCGGPPENGFVLRVLGRCCPGSRIERHVVLEHAKHDHGELARQRDLGLVGAGASGDPHRPAFEF